MKKRILCFLLSAAMLASVTACSGGGDASLKALRLLAAAPMRRLPSLLILLSRSS